jgi:hypothetical protein
VIGIVRNKALTEDKLASELGRKNIHILEADLSDHESLKVGRPPLATQSLNEIY